MEDRVVNWEEVEDEEALLLSAIDKIQEAASVLGYSGIGDSESLWELCDFLVLVLRIADSSIDFFSAVATLSRITQKDPAKVSRLLENLKPVVGMMRKIPPDSRVGLNVSSIVSQQLISTALFMARLLNQSSINEPEEMSFERFAALVYGWGRPGSFEVDPNLTRNRVKRFLDRIAEKNIIDGVLEKLSDAEFTKMLNSAWLYALGYERVKSRFLEMSSDDIDWSPDAFDSPEKWNSLTRERIGKLMDRYLDASFSLQTNDATPLDGPVTVIFSDVSGIQSFIRDTDRLVQMKAASALIQGFMKDALALAENGRESLHSVLRDMGVGLESIVYSGGGSILLMVSTGLAQEVMVGLSSAFDNTVGGPRLVSHAASFDYISSDGSIGEVPFVDHLNRVRTGLVVLKDDLTRTEQAHMSLGIELRCDSCHTRSATSLVTIGETRRAYCTSCADLYNFGQEYSFRAIFESETTDRPSGEKLLQHPWSNIGPQVLEFMAGDDLGANASLFCHDIALIKSDINLAGAFLADTQSLSALIEKSQLLSQGLDLAIESAMEWLVEAYADSLEELGVREVERMKHILRLQLDLGQLYVGGDDFMLLCPSALCIQLALKIGEEFGRLFSGRLALSFSVVTFDPTYPIRLVVDAAESLLEGCKKKTRKLSSDDLPLLVLDYEQLVGSLSTHEDLSELHSFLNDNKFSQRPHIIRGMSESILLAVSGCLDGKAVLEEMIRRSVEYQLALQRNQTKDVYLKDFMNAATEVLGQLDVPHSVQDSVDYLSSRGSGLSYTIYSLGRSDVKKRSAQVYGQIGALLIGDSGGRIGLLDAASIANIMTGGCS